jgi:hypothetical protein
VWFIPEHLSKNFLAPAGFQKRHPSQTPFTIPYNNYQKWNIYSSQEVYNGFYRIVF